MWRMCGVMMDNLVDCISMFGLCVSVLVCVLVC